MSRRRYKNTTAPPLAATGVTRLAVEAVTAVPGDWQESASCAQSDPEAFFPVGYEDHRPAVRVCLRCPVRAECLRYAVDNDIRFGVFGGMTPRERKRLRTGGPRRSNQHGRAA